MKILKVQIKNFKGIEDLEVDLKGRSVYLVGKNGVNKSSFIQSIFTPLTGKDIPNEPITKGKDKGEISVVVGHPDAPKYIVDLKFTENNKKGTLVVSAPDGAKYSSPRSFLQKIVGDLSFDPFEFIRMLEKEPKKAVEKIKEMLGLDFSALDAEFKEKYEQRTSSNAIVRKYNELIEETKKELNMGDITISVIEKYSEKVDVSKIVEQINTAGELAGKKSVRESEKKASEDIIESKQKDIDELRLKILRLEKEVEEEKKYVAQMDEEINNIEVPDVSMLREEYDESVKYNKIHEKIGEYIRNIEERDKAQNASDAITNELDSIKAEKQRKIEECEIPIDNLEIKDDGIYLDGLPFDHTQLNKSKIIEVGLKLGASLHKEVQVMRIEDGSLLDRDTLKSVLQFAKDNDYQLFIEQVDSDQDELKIQFVEDE